MTRLSILARVGLLPAFLTLLVAGQAQAAPSTPPNPLADAIAKVKAVGSKGQGSAEAQKAWQFLAQQPASQLPTLLQSLNDAGPLAANYLRAAIDTVAEKAVKTNNPLPLDALTQFVNNTKNNARARRLAFEWLVKSKPALRDKMLAGMLNDPSPELRRDAVQLLVSSAKKKLDNDQKKQAQALYTSALKAARDRDQVDDIVKVLKEKFDTTISLTEHFGLVTQWYVLGPFDNKDGKGFNTAYAPEEKVDVQKPVTNRADKELKWQKLRTDDEYGIFDVAKTVGIHKGSVFYFYTDFVSPADQTVQMRIGTPNAFKVWVNGKAYFAHEEYHRGMYFDQYRLNIPLTKGPNKILIKLCQNEQTEHWAQKHQLQCRLCDQTGTAVLSTDR